MHNGLAKNGTIRPKPTCYQLSSALALRKVCPNLANQVSIRILARAGWDLRILIRGSVSGCELAGFIPDGRAADGGGP